MTAAHGTSSLRAARVAGGALSLVLAVALASPRAGDAQSHRSASLAAAGAQSHRASAVAHGDTVNTLGTSDSTLVTGTLPNGLRYYLRANHAPAQRAELWLVVNAGSALEDESQRGLAHFVEHMAFNGTTHFGKQEIQHYLESMGMQFGGDLNAATNYDATTYRLTIPTDRRDALRTGIAILADWAHGITFDPTAVDAERGIILGEWRSRRESASNEVQERYAAALFAGSPYADHAPIGITDVIRSAPRSELVRFYHDWYTPERMAVIVVGDFDRDSVERLVKEKLGAIPASREPRQRPSLLVPVPDTSVAVVVAGPTLHGAGVTLAFRHTRAEPDTTRSARARLETALRRDVVEQLVAMILSERLDDASRGRVTNQTPVHGLHVYELRATTGAPAEAERSLGRLLAKVEQVRQHGYTASELDRARRWLLGEVDRVYAGRDAWTSRTLANAYSRYYLDEMPVPSPALRNAMTRGMLDGPGAITLTELNSAARDLLGPAGRVIFLAMASGGVGAVPTASELLALADSVEQVKHPAYDAAAATSRSLLASEPTPGSVVHARELEAIGARELKLANGARVILKPTSFAANQILVLARAPGGISVAPDSSYTDATLATQVVGASGLGSFDKEELVRRLRQRSGSVKLTPFIDALSQGVQGSAAPGDVETLFELLHLAFTAPRVDTAAVEVLRKSLRQRLSSGDVRTAQLIQSAMTWRHPRGRPLTAAMVDSLDPGAAIDFYRARFADAGAFTFYIVGAFDADSIRPLVERYIGGLPATHENAKWRDLGVRPPPDAGTISVNVRDAVKTSTRLVFTGEMTYDNATNLAANAMQRILQRRLLERLRTELHGTYGVQVKLETAQWPYAHYTLAVAFDADPAQADSLTAAALAVMDTLATHGPTSAELEDEKAFYERRTEEGARSDIYWLEMLSYYGWNGWSLDSDVGITTIDPLLATLTRDRVRDLARDFLDTSRMVRITLRPVPSAQPGRKAAS